MEQTLSATWIEVLAGAAAGAVIIVGGIWAVVGVLLSDLKRDYRTMRMQMDGVHIAIDNVAVSLAEMKAAMPDLVNGQGEILDGVDKLRGEVETVGSNVARMATFLGHLAGTPPSFPSDLFPK
jgi:L-rhamnose isomerase